MKLRKIMLSSLLLTGMALQTGDVCAGRVTDKLDEQAACSKIVGAVQQAAGFTPSSSADTTEELIQDLLAQAASMSGARISQAMLDLVGPRTTVLNVENRLQNFVNNGDPTAGNLETAFRNLAAGDALDIQAGENAVAKAQGLRADFLAAATERDRANQAAQAAQGQIAGLEQERDRANQAAQAAQGQIAAIEQERDAARAENTTLRATPDAQALAQAFEQSVFNRLYFTCTVGGASEKADVPAANGFTGFRNTKGMKKVATIYGVHGAEAIRTLYHSKGWTTDANVITDITNTLTFLDTLLDANRTFVHVPSLAEILELQQKLEEKQCLALIRLPVTPP